MHNFLSNQKQLENPEIKTPTFDAPTYQIPSVIKSKETEPLISTPK